MATAKTILASIRTIVDAVTGIDRVTSDRKIDPPGTGIYTASVLYRGEEITQWVINDGASRNDHLMPVAIDIRTTSASDDDLVDKVYAVLDAVLLPANKPSDVILMIPESIDEPEGKEYLTARINVIAHFRRS